MPKDKSSRDNRRHKRVYINKDLGLSGVKAVWPNGDESEVFDLSYKGAALSKPDSFNVQTLEAFDVGLELNGKQIQLQAEAMWSNDQVVGLELVAMDAVARMAIDEYLGEKLIGLHLALVPSHLTSGDLGCTYWFHGPNDTNVYVWSSGAGFDKVVIEYQSFVLRFESGKWSIGQGADEGGIQQAYSGKQLDSSNEQNTTRESEGIVEKVIGMLSQVPQAPEVITRLIVSLKNRA